MWVSCDGIGILWRGCPLGAVQHMVPPAAFLACGVVCCVKQASATLKRVVSRYPYEAPDGELSLKTEADHIGQEFCHLLNKRVFIAGAKVTGFQFNEISYSTEIAAGMLKRQQAGALVQARRLMVEGAVQSTVAAVEEIHAQGSAAMSEEEISRMVSNMILTLCTESNAQPLTEV